MRVRPPSPAAPAAASERWLWLLPRLALGLFVASVATQLWLTERAGREEERSTLANDALWLEQTLRFSIDHNIEILAQVDAGPAGRAETFEAQARTLLAGNTGLRQITLVDPDGRQRASLPAVPDRLSPATLDAARRLGRATHSPPYRDQSGEWRFQSHVPLFADGRFVGAAVATYELRKLLQDVVPWWLAQRNHIGIADLAGETLASRSQAGRETAASHRIAFDPPGHGLVLWLTPIRTPAPLSGRLLSSALVLLAVLVVWSLWALRRDVAKRLAAEQALREQHAFRTAMEDSLQTGLRARALDGRITYVNPAFCRMVGWSADELIGRGPPMPYWIEEEIDSTRALNDRILAGQGPRHGFEIRFQRRGGEPFWALVHEAPLVDAEGRHTGWMGSVVDISPQKQAEELARQQQERLQATARLVAMGEMASSLAHELNQPLAAISSYTTGSLNLIDSGRADLGEIRGVLAKTQAQARRAGEVVRRIYDFVRRAEPKSEPVDVAVLIGEICDLMEAHARRRRVRIDRVIAAELPTITGDRVLLGQALLNLLRNGIEAMQDAAGPHPRLRVDATAEAGWLRIRIADRGPGIPPEMAARLFEPFFTTKAEGMGMGLNICRSIVEAHRGRLWMEPRRGGGSVFVITLPAAPA